MTDNAEKIENFLIKCDVDPDQGRQILDRMPFATQLYEMGRLTSGQAASMAYVRRVVFLLECLSYGSVSVQWDREEMETEFERASQWPTLQPTIH